MVFNILFKDRVTKPQKKMLISLLRETKFIEGKKEKEWYWEKIQAALNGIGPKKTIIQWKKCWRDMRLTTRKKLAELKRCQLAGGSPPPGIELNQEDNDIIDIVGTEYFYEEMNGELKPENFMSNFDYVPEHFCDAILTATAASSSQQHSMSHQKDHNSQQEHHTNEGETNEPAGSSNQTDPHGGSFQSPNVSQLHAHNGEHPSNVPNHSNMPQHPAFHSGLHPHIIRRHHQSTYQRESAFEEKLLQLMQDVFPKKNKKRKRRDPDKLFLLSLYEEIKRVPEEIRLDVKAELIQVLKKYQKKSPVKQEKNNSNQQSLGASKQNSSAPNEKIPLPQQAQLSHSMYQLQKKYEKSEKETSPQSQVDRVQQLSRETATTVSLHPTQIPHGLFQLQQKKYEETSDKVLHQNEQRKHVDGTHQQQQQHSTHTQAPPPSSNEQHLHHPQMPHGIMFPLSQIRNEQSTTQQHHSHNPHQQAQHNPHNQQAQHHPSAIFGASAASASMSSDRSTLPYESVG